MSTRLKWLLKLTIPALYLLVAHRSVGQKTALNNDQQNDHKTRKVLFVSTNIDSVGSSLSGTFLMEIAFPFEFFTRNGITVDIVTPKGGKAAIYHSGSMNDALTSASANELFSKSSANSIPANKINPDQYDAIYYPGGHGQFWDVLSDERIAGIAARIYENGGVIGAAGHGTASLINIRLSDCNFLVSGKKMTCFPSWAEKLWMPVSNYGKLLPVDMQEVLIRRGAKLVISERETYKNKELTQVTDFENRIVTGSFAGSASWVAEEMLNLLTLAVWKK